MYVCVFVYVFELVCVWYCVLRALHLRCCINLTLGLTVKKLDACDDDAVVVSDGDGGNAAVAAGGSDVDGSFNVDGRGTSARTSRSGGGGAGDGGAKFGRGAAGGGAAVGSGGGIDAFDCAISDSVGGQGSALPAAAKGRLARRVIPPPPPPPRTGGAAADVPESAGADDDDGAVVLVEEKRTPGVPPADYIENLRHEKTVGGGSAATLELQFSFFDHDRVRIRNQLKVPVYPSDKKRLAYAIASAAMQRYHSLAAESLGFPRIAMEDGFDLILLGKGTPPEHTNMFVDASREVPFDMLGTVSLHVVLKAAAPQSQSQ